MAVDSLLRRAVETWGIELQLRVAAEECCELAAEILRHLRGRSSEWALACEIIDAEIGIEYAKTQVSPEALERARAHKRERLASVLDAIDAEASRDDDASSVREAFAASVAHLRGDAKEAG